MHRLGYNTPRNYEDNQLFCGGVQVKPALLWRSAGKASSSCTGMAVLPFLLEALLELSRVELWDTLIYFKVHVGLFRLCANSTCCEGMIVSPMLVTPAVRAALLALCL